MVDRGDVSGSPLDNPKGSKTLSASRSRPALLTSVGDDEKDWPDPKPPSGGKSGAGGRPSTPGGRSSAAGQRTSTPAGRHPGRLQTPTGWDLLSAAALGGNIWRMETRPTTLDDVRDDLYHENWFGDKDDKDDSDSSASGDDVATALRHWKKSVHALRNGSPNDNTAHSGGCAKFAVDFVDDADVQELLNVKGERITMYRTKWLDIFSAAMVIGNAITLGLDTDGYIDEDSWLGRGFEIGWLVAFSAEWLIRRYLIRLPLLVQMKNPLEILDLIIIFISALDVCIFTPLEFTVKGTYLISLFRILRIVRLARLIKLTRMVRDIWIMIISMLHTTPIVLWALFLVLVMSYISALFMIELTDCPSEYSLTNELVCGGLWRTILLQLQIATNTGCDELRGLYYESGGVWVLIVAILYICVTSICILNLIVGVMLTAAISNFSQDDRTNLSSAALNKHKKMMQLRDLLGQYWRKNHEGAGTPVVDRAQILELILADDDDQLLGEIFMDATREKVKTSVSEMWRGEKASGDVSLLTQLQDIFEDLEISRDNVEHIFEEYTSIVGQAECPVDDFISSVMWLQGTVQPLDMVLWISILGGFEDSMTRVIETLKGTIHCLAEASAEMMLNFEAAHTHDHAEHHLGDELVRKQTNGNDERPKGQLPLWTQGHEQAEQNLDEDFVRKLLNGKEERQIEQLLFRLQGQEAIAFREEQTKKKISEGMVRFELLLMGVIVANAITFGIQVSLPDDRNRCRWDLSDSTYLTPFWCLLDYFYVIVFSAELILRSILYYQLVVTQDFNQFAYGLPTLMFHLDWQSVYGILRNVRRMVATDHFLVLEVLIVLISIIDICILRFIDGAPELVVLQVFRILRLFRVMRLSVRVPIFHALVETFASNRALLFWAVFLALGFMYFIALIVVSVLGQTDAPEDSAAMLDWGTLPRAMLSLGQIATLTRWNQLMSEATALEPGLAVPLWIFFLIGAFVLLNLITGVMVKAYLQVSEDADVTLPVRSLKTTLKEAIAKVHLQANDMYTKEYEAAHDALEKLMEAHETTNDARTSPYELVGEDGRRLGSVWGLTWISSHQVACGLDIVGARVTKEDPFMARLLWKGGMSCPSMVFFDHEATKLIKCKVVFSNLPTLRSFLFKYGEGHTALVVVPTMTNGAKFCVNYPEFQLRPPNQNELSAHTFKLLLSDQALLKNLGRAGFRAEQALLIFQRLDVTQSGKVGVDDFLQCLVRLQTGLQGIDVAAAKSIMRRIVGECSELSRASLQCQECFAGVTTKLRGVSVATGVDEEVAKATSMEDQIIFKRQEIFTLKQKMLKIQRHIERRKELLSASGDALIQSQVEESETESIHSDNGQLILK